LSLNWHELNILGPIPNRKYGQWTMISYLSAGKSAFRCKSRLFLAKKPTFRGKKPTFWAGKPTFHTSNRIWPPDSVAAFSRTVCTVQVSLDGKDRWGHTPLSEAERFGHAHIVGLLKSSHQAAEREVIDLPIEVTDPWS
jgi:hypothetical protein